MKMTKEKIIIRVGNRLRITLRKYNIYVKYKGEKVENQKSIQYSQSEGIPEGGREGGRKKEKNRGRTIIKKIQGSTPELKVS